MAKLGKVISIFNADFLAIVIEYLMILSIYFSSIQNYFLE